MIIIGADHTGFDLKDKIIKYFKVKNIEIFDVSDYDLDKNDDYPDVAKNICLEVLKNNENLGIAICGTGIGISIACNKIKGIRAALCFDSYMAKLSKNHNNANVLCLGARLEYTKDIDNVINIIEEYINSDFEGNRHQKRLEKIEKLENNYLEGGISI